MRINAKMVRINFVLNCLRTCSCKATGLHLSNELAHAESQFVLLHAETLKTSGIFRKPQCRYWERTDSRVLTACQTPRVRESISHETDICMS